MTRNATKDLKKNNSNIGMNQGSSMSSGIVALTQNGVLAQKQEKAIKAKTG